MLQLSSSVSNFLVMLGDCVYSSLVFFTCCLFIYLWECSALCSGTLKTISVLFIFPSPLGQIFQFEWLFTWGGDCPETMANFCLVYSALYGPEIIQCANFLLQETRDQKWYFHVKNNPVIHYVLIENNNMYVYNIFYNIFVRVEEIQIVCPTLIIATNSCLPCMHQGCDHVQANLAIYQVSRWYCARERTPTGNLITTRSFDL
jgi:hypothetical protein